MAQLGKSQVLPVIKVTDFGPFVDAGELGEVLIPRVFLEKPLSEGDEIDVFIYLDPLERLVATPHMPKGQVGEFACLQCKAATEIGAFLDWGLPQDLFVPFKEQKEKMQVGKYYVVFIYHDEVSDRLAASSKIDFELEKTGGDYEVGQEVDLMIAYATDLGYKAIINNTHSGVIFYNDIFKKVQVGDRLTGYIKNIREDGKIDLALQKQGFGQVKDLSQVILERLRERGGTLPLSDKSDPDDISRAFGVSKKAFKKAIGVLYKQRLIVIEEDHISLARTQDN